ncbi:hypothetical protein [uncultured Bradyrhizobium sp.]|jgi:hypothetical protein|uniref:hypothetical protein n=1 Tax=uncultured Bradyrhizobium sp. TaxID=199684 RepID=UPI0026207C07|nr:hypothetical protein [uncultured Bradyrhizobium sp.]
MSEVSYYTCLSRLGADWWTLVITDYLLKPLTLADEIRREPHYAKSRFVWSYNGRHRPAGMGMRIL